MRRSSWIVSILAVLAVVSLPACRKGEAGEADAKTKTVREFSVTGIIRGALSDGQILIEHQEVPGFMPAMTMPFYVADANETTGLVVGDRVRFRFVVGENSRADRFVVLGHEDTPAALPTTSSADPATKRVKVGERVPDFDLVDQSGQVVTAAQFDGHYTVVTFIFTRCPVPEFCPAITLKFSALQSRIKESENLRARARLLGISLDPEFDRPDVLRAFGEAVGFDPAIWKLATGDTPTVDHLLRSFSVFTERRAGILDHTLCTALIGPDRRIQEIWRGNAWKVDEVIAALETGTTSIR